MLKFCFTAAGWESSPILLSDVRTPYESPGRNQYIREVRPTTGHPREGVLVAIIDKRVYRVY